MVEYHPTWCEEELPAILHRLRDAGGGTAFFGTSERGDAVGIEDPDALKKQLFAIGFAQRPRIIPTTSVSIAPNGANVLECEVGEFTIRDMPCYVP